MIFSDLSLIVTEACNYDCVYCYKKKSKNHMDMSTVEKALNFFYPD